MLLPQYTEPNVCFVNRLQDYQSRAVQGHVSLASVVT